MLKSAFQKNSNLFSLQFFKISNLKNFYQNNIINNNKNNFFFLQKRNFTIDNNINNPETEEFFKKYDSLKTENKSTSIVTREKKHKKKIIKTKSEGQIKYEEPITEEQIKTPITEEKEKIKFEEEKKIEKPEKISKEDELLLKKQAFKNKIKETFNLKDMYKITSTKMGSPNVRKFIDFSKLKHPNVVVKIWDRDTFQKDEEIKTDFTPISPKLGPFIVINIFLN